MTDAVLIVTGGKLQTPTVVVAEELGLHVILTDRDPDCCCAERADEFYPIDIYDVKAHVKLAMDLQRRSDINLRGVFTAAADPVKTVAQAAACAALPHAPLSAVDAANRKDVMRETLSFFGGVQQPRWLKREAGQSLGHTILQVGLPAIVKNIKGAGGRGHTLFRSEADLTDDKLTLALRRAVSYRNQPVLVEQFLEGLELSVEVVWYDGVMYPLNIVERPFAHNMGALWKHTDGFVSAVMNYGYPSDYDNDMGDNALEQAVDDGYMIELGHYNPAILSCDDTRAVWHVMRRCGDALGLGRSKGGHIHKCDMILTEAGPKVLETTLRLSGNWDSGATSPLAHGVDYTKAALLMAMGVPPDWTLLAPRWHRHAVCLFKFVPPGKVVDISVDEGYVKSFNDLGVLFNNPSCCYVPRYDVGDVVPPLTSYATLAGWAIAEGASRSEAVLGAVSALKRVQYETEAVDDRE